MTDERAGTQTSATCVNRTRRRLLGAMALMPFAGRAAFAEEVIDLEWSDLLPEGQQVLPQALQGLIDHDTAPLETRQPASVGVRTDWNGRTVRLPGFVVPLDYDGTAVRAFLLVPFVGACVHVPPPPANQLVLVTAPTPFASKGLFEPVRVTGMFGTASTHTQMAEVGYALSADKIEPFGQ